MTKLDSYIDDLVVANRILAAERIVDAFGHISVRHPDRSDRYLLSRSRAPQCVEPDDIMEFTLSGEPVDAKGRAPYFERFIHGGIYQSWPEARSVIHSHSKAVIPFSVSGEAIRPLMQNCASIGHSVPVWDSRTRFGDTDLMVTNMEMARDLVRTLGRNQPCSCAVMVRWRWDRQSGARYSMPSSCGRVRIFSRKSPGLTRLSTFHWAR